MQTRRDFLRLCGLSAPLLASFPSCFARALASGPAGNDRILILLRLGGGNDGLNTVIPVEDDLYHRARPTLGISKERALALKDGLALHPSLTGLRSLNDDGLVSVVNSVGYPVPDRSHFRSMDIWQSARPDNEDRKNGWIGRALDPQAVQATQAVPAIAVVRHEMPLAVVGEHLVTPSLPSFEQFLLRDQSLLDLMRARRTAANDALRHVTDAGLAAVRTAARVHETKDDVRHDAFPASRLGRDMATVATLMNSGLGTRVFYVAHDGFDTHTQQAGNHAGLLRDLGDSVAALFRELKRTGDADRVLLVTFSEFGRRVRENASRGTDHGAAAPLFAVSGAIRPGIIGDPPDLEDLDDGDVRHRIDFRRVYATILDRWLDIDSRHALGGRFEPLPFIA